MAPDLSRVEMSEPPEKMYVTTDAVALSYSADRGLQVLLIERANEPYKGRWALPGGFVGVDEDLADACARELHEETGVRHAAMVQIGAWGKPGRDPRGRNVSVAYLAVVRPGQQQAEAADDAARAAWHPACAPPPLAFDHAEIVSAGLARLRSLAASTHIAFAFLQDRFGLGELRDLLSAVNGGPVSMKKAQELADHADLVTEPPTDSEAECFRCEAEDFLAPLPEG